MDIDRHTVFKDLIRLLMDPASNATYYAKITLKLDQSAIPTLINERMNQFLYPFFNSFNSFSFNAVQTEQNERDFAINIQKKYTNLPVDFPDLWVEFVNGIRIIMQEQIGIVQQRKRQIEIEQQKRKIEIEPVLGPVKRMPPGISKTEALPYAAEMEKLKKNMYTDTVPSSMSIPRPMPMQSKQSKQSKQPKGGKKSRSKKRGRESVHRRNKSTHNKRR